MTAILFVASAIVALIPTFTVGHFNGVSLIGLVGMILFGVWHRKVAR